MQKIIGLTLLFLISLSRVVRADDGDLDKKTKITLQNAPKDSSKKK